jgi:hypothetical protein
VTIVVGFHRRAKARRSVLLVPVGLALLPLPWLLMLLLAFVRNVAPAIAGWPADIARLIALVFASTSGLAVLRRCRGFLIAIQNMRGQPKLRCCTR